MINFDAVDFSERGSEEVSFDAQCSQQNCMELIHKFQLPRKNIKRQAKFWNKKFF